jgi:S1 RNA binding domain
MREWQRMDEGKRYRNTGFWDQASWNRLLQLRTAIRRSKTKWLAEPFPEGKVMFPMYLDLDYRRYSQAAITHNCGCNALVKIEFTFGLYMRTFFAIRRGCSFRCWRRDGPSYVRFPIGTTITRPVRNLTAYGAFVELEEGIDGMIHVSDLSWTRKINHPSELLKKGQEVEANVIGIDKANQRISLGMKQLENAP